MKIRVTEEHIKDGKRSHVRYCPVARAISSALPGYWTVTGSEACLRSADGQGLDCKYYLLPHGVSAKIAAFDNECGMEPFEFELPTENRHSLLVSEVKMTDEQIRKLVQEMERRIKYWQRSVHDDTINEYDIIEAVLRREIGSSPHEAEFCRYCGAGVGKFRREGEGTCLRCDPRGWDRNLQNPKNKA